MFCIRSMQKLSSRVTMKAWRVVGTLNLSHVIKIFIESALLYILSVAACLVTELMGTNWNYAVSGVVSLRLRWTGLASYITDLNCRVWSYPAYAST